MEQQYISKEIWDKIYSQSPIGIAVLGLDRNFLMVNSKLCSFLGYTEQELLALSIKSITHPEDDAAEVSELERLKGGLIPGFEILKRLLTKNGRIRWVKQTIWPIKEDDNKIINFVAHIQPLLNGEKAKMEQVQDKEIHIRPTLTIKEFVLDNLKSFVAAVIFFITTSIGVGVAFNSAIKEIDRLKGMQIKQQQLIERLNDRLFEARNE